MVWREAYNLNKKTKSYFKTIEEAHKFITASINGNYRIEEVRVADDVLFYEEGDSIEFSLFDQGFYCSNSKSPLLFPQKEMTEDEKIKYDYEQEQNGIFNDFLDFEEEKAENFVIESGNGILKIGNFILSDPNYIKIIELKPGSVPILEEKVVFIKKLNGSWKESLYPFFTDKSIYAKKAIRGEDSKIIINNTIEILIPFSLGEKAKETITNFIQGGK